jgi:hypothetical protein
MNNADIARKSLNFFHNGQGLVHAAGQFLSALSDLANEEGFELADCLMAGWTSSMRDKNGDYNQFVRAAAALGIQLLKNASDSN